MKILSILRTVGAVALKDGPPIASAFNPLAGMIFGTVANIAAEAEQSQTGDSRGAQKKQVFNDRIVRALADVLDEYAAEEDIDIKVTPEMLKGASDLGDQVVALSNGIAKLMLTIESASRPAASDVTFQQPRAMSSAAFFNPPPANPTPPPTTQQGALSNLTPDPPRAMSRAAFFNPPQNPAANPTPLATTSGNPAPPAQTIAPQGIDAKGGVGTPGGDTVEEPA